MKQSSNDASRHEPQGSGGASNKLGVLVSGLIAAGVIDPPMELERLYNERRLKAQIEPDGTVTCMGRNFCTLSSAASHARSTCTDIPAGEHALSCNGWSFWQFRDEAGELRTIGSLRRHYLRG